MSLDHILSIFALLGATVGGVLSLFFWWQSVKTRRAEWLYSLHEKFYEDSCHKKTRLLLDYRPKEELERLYKGLEEDCYPDVCEPLVDYLNFFEFIAGLWIMHQLSLKEIRMLFQYYLELLKTHPPVMNFIKRQGFESLHSLLDAVGGTA